VQLATVTLQHISFKVQIVCRYDHRLSSRVLPTL
jgi:hypothetical protein